MSVIMLAPNEKDFNQGSIIEKDKLGILSLSNPIFGKIDNKTEEQ
jgi:hypothetical protein